MKIQRTRQFATWIDALKDVTARARILARIGRLAEGHPGDHRYLGDGISELRIDAEPGYRVYYTQRGRQLVILLVGGDKAHSNAISKRPGRLHVPCERRTGCSRNESIPKYWSCSIMATKKKVELKAFDVAEHLRTPEEMAAYLDACIEESDGDSAFIAKALGDIARAQGMSKVARAAGLSRESLYRALSGERSPDFATILKVTRALGVRLHASAV